MIVMVEAACAQVLSLQEEVDELKRQRKEVLLLSLHPGLHVVANAHAQTPERLHLQEAEARGEVEQTATKLQADNTKLVKENVT